MIEQKVKQAKHGFDTTVFPDYSWDEMIASYGISKAPSLTEQGWEYRGDDVLIITHYNLDTGQHSRRPDHCHSEPGMAGYVGIEGESSKVTGIAQDIRRLAYYKGESPGKRGYI